MDLAAKIQGMASRPFVSLDDLSKDRSTNTGPTYNQELTSLDEKPQTGRLELRTKFMVALTITV